MVRVVSVMSLDFFSWAIDCEIELLRGITVILVLCQLFILVTFVAFVAFVSSKCQEREGVVAFVVACAS